MVVVIVEVVVDTGFLGVDDQIGSRMGCVGDVWVDIVAEMDVALVRRGRGGGLETDV